MTRSKQKAKLNCYKCKNRKCNWFSMCGECSQIYCATCLNDHECSKAIEDRENKNKPKKRRNKKHDNINPIDEHDDDEQPPEKKNEIIEEINVDTNEIKIIKS